MTKNATLHLIYSLISYPLSTYFISTYFFQTCHLLLKIKLMKKFRLPLKVRINIDTKQTEHLLSDVSKQQFPKSCVIFSIYLPLIDYIRNLSDADLRLCLEEHSGRRRTKQQAEHIYILCITRSASLFTCNNIFNPLTSIYSYSNIQPV